MVIIELFPEMQLRNYQGPHLPSLWFAWRAAVHGSRKGDEISSEACKEKVD